MREQIENRLQALTAEYKAGQEMLADLQARESNLRITLARISGAIQVLEELMNQNVDESPERVASLQNAL